MAYSTQSLAPLILIIHYLDSFITPFSNYHYKLLCLTFFCLSFFLSSEGGGGYLLIIVIYFIFSVILFNIWRPIPVGRMIGAPLFGQVWLPGEVRGAN